MNSPQESTRTDPAHTPSSYERSAGTLLVAFGLAGVLTYAYFAIASHSLGEDRYGELVVLWSASFLLASTVFRPVEQLLAHSLADHAQPGAQRRHTLTLATRIQSGMLAILLVALIAARSPIERELLGDDSFLYWMLLASLAGLALGFFARGFLAGRSQFGYYAALLLGEVVLRLAFVVPVAIGIAEGSHLAAVGIGGVALAALTVLPLAIRGHPIGEVGPDPDGDPADGSIVDTPLAAGKGTTFTAAVLVMMLCEQILVTSGALIVQVAEGAAAAGFIFNVMLVARAPLVLFQAVIASLLPHLSRLRAAPSPANDAEYHRSVRRTIAAVSAVAGAIALGVLAIGPPVMEIAFGGEQSYDRLGLVIVAVGMGFYLSALALNQAALANGQAKRAVLGWLLASACFITFNLMPGIDPFRAVEIGFASAAVILSIWLLAIYRTT